MCHHTARRGSRVRNLFGGLMKWNRILVRMVWGVAVTGVAVITFYSWAYWIGATHRLEGEITDVRTLGMDKNSSVAIVNFKATNASNHVISVRHREIAVVDASGGLHEGRILSVFDIQQLFKYFPALGGMKDEPLTDNRDIEPGEAFRGLSAARFEIPKHELDMCREIAFRTVDPRSRRTEFRQVSE